MASRALGAGGADGGIRPSLTGVHAVAPDRVGREPPSGFSFSAPFFLVTSSHPSLLILRGVTDIRTSTPAPFPWSARATDRLHSPLHLCLWPHHSPRLRSPPGPSRHPRVPLSTPRTTPDSSSSSCLDRKSLGPAQTISASIPLSTRLQKHQSLPAFFTVSSSPTGLASSPDHCQSPLSCVSHFSAGCCGDRGGTYRIYHCERHPRSCRTKYPQQLSLLARSLSTRNGKHAGNQLRPQQPQT